MPGCGTSLPDPRPSYPNLSGFTLVSVLYGTVTWDAGFESSYFGGPLGGWIFSSGAEAIFEPTTPLNVTGLWPMTPTCAYIHPEVTVDGVVIIPDTIDWETNPVTVVSGVVESLYAKNYSAYDRIMHVDDFFFVQPEGPPGTPCFWTDKIKVIEECSAAPGCLEFNNTNWIPSNEDTTWSTDKFVVGAQGPDGINQGPLIETASAFTGEPTSITVHYSYSGLSDAANLQMGASANPYDYENQSIVIESVSAGSGTGSITLPVTFTHTGEFTIVMLLSGPFGGGGEGPPMITPISTTQIAITDVVLCPP
jgi:hypothetical protein